MSQPRYLLDLQEIDTQLDKAKVRLNEIEVLLSGNAELKAAMAKVDDTQAIYQEAERTLRYAEQEVGEQAGKIKNNQNVLYSGSVTNSKELEDLQNEAAALNRHLATLEDRQLEAMVAYETAENDKDTAKVDLQNTKNKVATENSTLTAEQDTLTKLVEELSESRPKTEATIDREDIETYSKLRTKRVGLAVVAVTSPECPACGSAMTAADAQAARSPNKLTFCNGCGRILVAK